MAVGTIIRVNAKRGFAFIRPDAGTQDVFLHCSALIGSPLIFAETLQEMRVSFDTEQSEKGLRAINIRAAD